MKNSFRILLSVAALSFVMLSDVKAAPPTKDIVVSINDAFIPGGFDSEADAYVVVSGLFPNGCYKWKGGVVKHVSTFDHEIHSVASVSQGMCIQVLVPFSKEIKLGKLNTGKHSLKFLSNDGTYLEKAMVIE